MQIPFQRTHLSAVIGTLLLGSLVVLNGCSSNDNNSTGETSSASKSTVISAGEQCTYGGIQVDTGIDENKNGVLDDSEIDSTDYVCNGADGEIYSSSIAFTEIAPAITDIEKSSIRAATEVSIAGEKQTIGYHTLIKTGDTDNGETFGVVKDFQDAVITAADASPYLCNGTDSGQGSGLDHVSILNKNDKLYMVSQFECGPGAMYMNELNQAEDGTLSLKANSLKYISQKDEFGGWVHCAGMTTPWQSHLGSEEYEADANPDGSSYNYTKNSYFSEVTQYYWGGDATLNNPYYYGWTPEVQIDANGDPQYTKHYSMGRFAHELAYVMPDRKTVYMSDDGSGGVLFMYIADSAEDLSAGQLYAAKWNQTSATGLGEAVLTWVDMGHASDTEVRAIVAAKKSFSDLFNTETMNADGSCPTAGTGLDASNGFKSVNTAGGVSECLQLKDITGDSLINDADIAIAARMESRRMAAMLGATSEFDKKEGITFNSRDKELYLAISQVRYGMEDSAKKGSANTKYDIGGNNDIQLGYNYCGGVYALGVAANEDIGSDYVAYSMKGLVAGTPTDYTGTALAGNTCDVDGIANPDNLTFLEDSNMLVIGEDTGSHPNDMVWAYDVSTDKMARIATTPYGSETTSPFWYKDLNGFGYLSLVTQHPFGEVGDSYVRPTGVDIKSEAGYIGSFDFSKLK